jgi:GntR family transcriptional regulator/MocR family aminotransferase
MTANFRFGGSPLDPLQTLDGEGRVIYVGSFSKTLLPTLRLGFLIAPQSLRSALHKAKLFSDWHTTTISQAAFGRLIDEGKFAQHIRRATRLYTGLIGETISKVTIFPDRPSLDQRGRFSHKHCLPDEH